MRWMRVVAGCVASVTSVGACGTSAPDVPDEGIRIEARQAVLVTQEPLGDVVTGELEAGDAATAVCFVSEARTNTGAVGSAVMVESGRLAGYASVTTLPAGAADRASVFDVDDNELRERLPACSP